MEQQLDEESKDTIPIISDLTSTGRVERKKYLKQTGKSLWMKNKGKKTNTLSIEVSTRSSDSCATFLGSNYQGSTNQKEKEVYFFLDSINVNQVNFTEMLKKTVVTFDNKVKLLSSAHDTIQKSNKTFAPKKKLSYLQTIFKNKCFIKTHR